MIVSKILPIKIVGSKIVKLTNILLIKISLTSIGKDFKIHKFLPSKDIAELVVHDKAQKVPNTNGPYNTK